MDPNKVWAAGRLASGGPSDGGRARVPTLKGVHDPVTRVVTEAITNEAKSAAFYQEFFPPKMLIPSTPQNPVYPEPAYAWHPLTDAILHRTIAKMKPYKATRAGSFPNMMYQSNAHLLMPYLGPIYRALDELEYYPPGWNHTDSIVLRKPGKPDYTVAGAYRPVVLSYGKARIYHAAKTMQVTTESELVGILPNNHYG
ncbi:hypothetical protein C8R44DRAFT_588077, partial [Mycena epipterygia]